MKIQRFVLVLFVFALLALPLAVGAQDTAPSPTVWLDRLQTGVTISFIVGGLLGAIAGGGSALATLNRVDRHTKDNAERLFESLSPAWQATIVQVVASAEEAVHTAAAAVALLREVTDGQPNSEPTAQE